MIFFDSKRKIFWFIIVLGVVLRLGQFLDNPSLALDESWAALGTISKSLTDIVGFSNNNNLSGTLMPVGFEMISKGAILLWGNYEYALRMFPLVSSILSLFLFSGFVQRCANPRVALSALGMFAVCVPMVGFSAFFKPYSSDVLVSITLYCLFLWLRDNQYGIRSIFVFVWAGVAALFLAHSSSFILGGIGATLCYIICRQKMWSRVPFVLMGGLIWASCLYAIYQLSFQPMLENRDLLDMWRGRFVPGGANVMTIIAWSTDKLFSYLLATPWPVPAAGCFVFGVISLRRKDPEVLAVLFLPAFGAWCASLLHKYPFHGRMLLFLAPAVFFLIAEGVFFVAEKTKKMQFLVSLLFLGILFYGPIKAAGYSLLSSSEQHDMKSLTRYFKQHYRDGDAIFMNNSAQFSYGYYHGYFGMGNAHTFIGIITDDFTPTPEFLPGEDVFFSYENYTEEGYDRGHLVGPRIDRLTLENKEQFWDNERTWVIFSYAAAEHKQRILDYFDHQGKKEEEFLFKGASLYLYDLSDEGKRGSREISN